MGRGRAPCCEKIGLNRGSWTPAEDVRLMAYIRKHGHANWRALPKQAGLLRCGKSCRLRWINYLRPDIKRGNFSEEEEDTIIRLHGALGNKWSKIASCLSGRTDNEIKNVWNTHLKKRLVATTTSPAKDKEDRKPPAAANDKSEEDLPSSPASSVVTSSMEPSLGSRSSSSTSMVILKDPLEEMPDISIEPEIWNMIGDEDACDDRKYEGPSGGTGGGGDSESERWLAYLEKELELWGGSGDANHQEFGDPVTSYFQKSLSSSSSSTPLDDLLY